MCAEGGYRGERAGEHLPGGNLSVSENYCVTSHCVSGVVVSISKKMIPRRHFHQDSHLFFFLEHTHTAPDLEKEDRAREPVVSSQGAGLESFRIIHFVLGDSSAHI